MFITVFSRLAKLFLMQKCCFFLSRRRKGLQEWQYRPWRAVATGFESVSRFFFVVKSTACA
jgi:hypothetical protein